MKHLYKLFTLFILCPFLSYAQSNYKSGYVITLKGDTLHGFVDYHEWNSNPTVINFKTDLAVDKTKKYTAGEVNYINITGLDEYRRYEGAISMDYTDPNHVSNGKDTTFRTDAVFLKVLQKGNNVSLYSYTDGIKVRFYINDGANYSPAELGYHIYTNSNATSQIGTTVVEKTYGRQLFSLAQKYNMLTDDLQQDIARSEYSRADIIKIVSRINGLSQAEYLKKYDAPVKIFIFGGLALNITNTNPSSLLKAQGWQSYTSYLPAVSVGINIPANPNTGKLIFRVEGIFAESEYKLTFNNEHISTNYTGYSFKTLSAAVAPQVIYNIYNSDDFKFYAGAGFKFTFNSYTNPEFTRQNGSKVKGNSNSFDQYVAFSTPIIVKAGVLISKKIEIYGDYQTPTPLSHDNQFEVSVTNVQFGINYFFNSYCIHKS